jgi:hypothetical protein
MVQILMQGILKQKKNNELNSWNMKEFDEIRI